MLASSMDICILLELASAAPLPRIAMTGAAFCALTASGHVAAPPTSAMNWRRLIVDPVPGVLNLSVSDLSVWIQPVECALWLESRPLLRPEPAPPGADK